MKVFLDSPRLGNEIRKVMAAQRITQMRMAEALNVTQGQISNVVRGRFRTNNNLVRRVCKYVKVNAARFRANDYRETSSVPLDISASLIRLCSRSRERRGTVLKILSLLEDLT